MLNSECRSRNTPVPAVHGTAADAPAIRDRIGEVNRRSACSFKQKFAQSRFLSSVRTLAMMHINAAPMTTGVRGMCAHSPIGGKSMGQWADRGSGAVPRYVLA